MKLHISQLPCDEPTFRSKLAAYLAELEAHKLTVGVPAPFPEYEIMRTIADQGGELEVYEDPPAEPPTPEQLEAAELLRKRAAALRALDDARLAEAALDLAAPQEVKDYAEALLAK